MGANHARVIADSSSAALHVVIDEDLERARAIAEHYGCRAAANSEASADCDAVVVATATASHKALAMPLLENGIPTLMEKPLAEAVADVEAMVDAAARSSTPFMCGFVERFNPALVTALGLVDEPVVHLNATRHSPASPRATSSVVLDLLIHDLDLALRVAQPSVPAYLGSHRWGTPSSPWAEIADALLAFESGMVASLSSSRWSQRKIRDVRIATASQLFEVDLVRHDVTVYRHVRHLGTDGDARTYRAETIIDIPFVRPAGEPLALQFNRFMGLVTGELDMIDELESVVAPHRLAIAIENDEEAP